MLRSGLVLLASVIFVACDVDAAPSFPLADAGAGLPTSCGALPDGVLSPAHVFRDATDLARLASLPTERYRGRLASSYDRASISPTSPGWFANSDASGSEGFEDGERIMLDVDGPGVITRIWSANPSGRVRIYLDHAEEPAIDVTFVELLTEGESVTGTSIVAHVGNAPTYFGAIVFGEHVRVTATSAGSFYAIDYRAYAPGITVAPTLDPSDAVARCHRDAARALIEGERFPPPTSTTRALELVSGTPQTITATEGGAVITRLRVSGLNEPTSGARATLRIAFDGETTVEAPVDRLFLYDRDADPARSIAHTTDPATGAAELRFPMPFAASATFTLDGAVGETLRVELSEQAQPFLTGSLHFHARWSGPTTFDVFARHDFDVVTVEGEGRYVGTGLRVHNPARGWWGEGDEKIWVDDDTFPSHFGTGTEDYFGYAYCSTERFDHAYFGQSRSNFTNYGGVTSLHRLHVADAIPFRTGIDFDLEVTHWEDMDCHTDVTYDATSYFYARPGATVSDVFESGDPSDVPALPEGTIERSGETTTCRVFGQPASCE